MQIFDGLRLKADAGLFLQQREYDGAQYLVPCIHLSDICLLSTEAGAVSISCFTSTYGAVGKCNGRRHMATKSVAPCFCQWINCCSMTARGWLVLFRTCSTQFRELGIWCLRYPHGQRQLFIRSKRAEVRYFVTPCLHATRQPCRRNGKPSVACVCSGEST